MLFGQGSFKYWALVPLLVVLTVFTVLPIIQLLQMSVSELEFVEGELVSEFIGLGQLDNLAEDPIVGIALKNTLVFVILFPVFYIVQTSLKSTADIYSGTFFFEAKTRNYEEIFTGSRSNFAELTRNSLVVSSAVAVICGVIGSLAAYSISRLNWSRWVTGGILVWLLFINMMPPIVFVTPYYLWARGAGIYDTPQAVIMAHMVLNMPLAVIMMMNFFAEAPKELE